MQKYQFILKSRFLFLISYQLLINTHRRKDPFGELDIGPVIGAVGVRVLVIQIEGATDVVVAVYAAVRFIEYYDIVIGLIVVEGIAAADAVG